MGDSLKCLRAFPLDARRDLGYQIEALQQGGQPADFKPMPGIGKGVEEIRVQEAGRAFRVIYRALRTIATEPAMSKLVSYASIWDAIADSPEEAANMRMRAELMRKIAALVKKAGWTQADAARHCGVTQPRLNDLVRGKISRFSLDALVNIATALGCKVSVHLKAA